MTISALTAAVSFLLFSAVVEGQSTLDWALANILRRDANTFWIELGQSRPRPVQPEVKATILSKLPEKGVIRDLKEPARRKLATVIDMFLFFLQPLPGIGACAIKADVMRVFTTIVPVKFSVAAKYRFPI